MLEVVAEIVLEVFGEIILDLFGLNEKINKMNNLFYLNILLISYP